MKIRIALIVGVLAVGSSSPFFGEDFKFKVTPKNEFDYEFYVYSGRQVILNACWSKAKADLYWVVGCQGSGDAVIIAYGDSDEELCEGLQIGLPDLDGEPLTCVAGLYSWSGTGKGYGSFQLTGKENGA